MSSLYNYFTVYYHKFHHRNSDPNKHVEVALVLASKSVVKGHKLVSNFVENGGFLADITWTMNYRKRG